MMTSFFNLKGQWKGKKQQFQLPNKGIFKQYNLNSLMKQKSTRASAEVRQLF